MAKIFKEIIKYSRKKKYVTNNILLAYFLFKSFHALCTVINMRRQRLTIVPDTTNSVPLLFVVDVIKVHFKKNSFEGFICSLLPCV